MESSADLEVKIYTTKWIRHKKSWVKNTTTNDEDDTNDSDDTNDEDDTSDSDGDLYDIAAADNDDDKSTLYYIFACISSMKL